MDYTKIIELMTRFPHSTRWCDIVSIGNWMLKGYSFEEAFRTTLEGFGEKNSDNPSTEYLSLSHTAWEMSVVLQGHYI